MFHGHDAVAFHRRLQRADRVDFRDPDLRRKRAQRLRAAFADIAITADDGDLAGDHHIGCALDAVNQRLAAAVEVVELRFGHRVIDVDGRNLQIAARVHLVEAVYAGRRFLGHAADVRQAARIPGRVGRQMRLDRGKEDGFFFRFGMGEYGNILFRACAQMQQQRCVAAVIEDHVGGRAVRPFKNAVRVFPIIGERFALDGENGHAARSNGGGSVILRRENVA